MPNAARQRHRWPSRLYKSLCDASAKFFVWYSDVGRAFFIPSRIPNPGRNKGPPYSRTPWAFLQLSFSQHRPSLSTNTKSTNKIFQTTPHLHFSALGTLRSRVYIDTHQRNTAATYHQPTSRHVPSHPLALSKLRRAHQRRGAATLPSSILPRLPKKRHRRGARARSSMLPSVEMQGRGLRVEEQQAISHPQYPRVLPERQVAPSYPSRHGGHRRP